MVWFFFAFLVPMLWALNVVIDDYILRKKLKDASSYNIWTALTDIFPILIIFPLFNPSFVMPYSLIAVFVGSLIFIGLYFYNRSLMKEEASRVVSLSYTSPIFVAIIAFIFLRQVLEIPNYIGLVLLVIGAILVSEEKIRGKKFIISPILGIVLFYTIIFSVGDILSSYSVNNTDYISFFYWSNVGSILSAVFLMGIPKIRINFFRQLKLLDKKFYYILLLTVFVFYVGELSLYKAFEEGLVTLVATILALEPMFVFFYTLELSIHRPEILKEKLDRTTILTKFFAILFIIAGTYLTAFA